MDETTFRIFAAIGISVGALAMAAQAAFIFFIYKTVKSTDARVSALSDRAEPLIDSARRMLDENRPKLTKMADDALEVVSSAREQMTKIEGLVGDATGRARVQLDRLDLVLTDTVERVQETAATVQSSILHPVREVSGVMNGVRAAISTLAKGQRTPVPNATQDEEMFI